MPSYNIPETVVGTDLFVPESDDQFTVNVGGLPNGDDCLTIHGDVDQGYRAYQGAQTVAGNPFTSRTDFNWSMSFWYKSEALPVSPGSGYRCDNTLFGVMNANYQPATPGQIDTSYGTGYNHNILWAMVSVGTTGLGFIRPLNGSTYGAGPLTLSVASLTPGWHHIVVNITNASRGQMFVDATLVSDDSSGNMAGGGISNGFFSLGAYSQLTGVAGRGAEHDIGKLYFHNHALSETERQTLYTAMVGV